MAVLFYNQGKDLGDKFFVTFAVPKVLQIPTDTWVLN